MRRQPKPFEVAAKTDFAAIEALHIDGEADALKLLNDEWLPNLTPQAADKIKALGDSPSPADLAGLQLDPPDHGPLHKLLLSIATQAADDAGAELSAQSITAPAAKVAALEDMIAGQAEAMAWQVTQGVTLATTRKAVQLTNPAVPVSGADLAAGVSEYLSGLVHGWERRQLGGAVQQAQTAGRFARFDQIADVEPVRYYVSSLLDEAACEVCVGDDGTEFDTLDEALAFFPSGSNPDCLGGPNCRCTCVAVAGSEV